jgi:hypothetical protein
MITFLRLTVANPVEILVVCRVDSVVLSVVIIPLPMQRKRTLGGAGFVT